MDRRTTFSGTLLPILLVIGVVGPIVSLLALSWLRYGAKRPRRGASNSLGAKHTPELLQRRRDVGERVLLEAQHRQAKPGQQRALIGRRAVAPQQH